MKRLLSTIILIVLSSCLTTKAPIPPKHIPSFDYTPETREQVNSTGIKVALIKTRFYPRGLSVTDKLRLRKPPYLDFRDAISNDLEEILTSKGVTILGPFSTHDEMVYSEKQNSDMLVSVQIELKERKNYRTKAFPSYTGGQTYYRVYGGVHISGKLNLTVMDPIDKEKFFKKSIELEPKEVVFGNPLTRWYSQPSYKELLEEDPNVYNPVVTALEEYYKGAMEKIWNHIDTRELEEIKKQIHSKQR